jgi:hypothetical protein
VSRYPLTTVTASAPATARCDSFTSSSAATASTSAVADSSCLSFVSQMNSWRHIEGKTQLITVLTDINLATKYADTTGAELSAGQDASPRKAARS